MLHIAGLVVETCHEAKAQFSDDLNRVPNPCENPIHLLDEGCPSHVIVIVVVVAKVRLRVLYYMK